MNAIRPNQPAPRPNPYVSTDLLNDVKKELGNDVLTGFGDDKVDTLKRYFIDGEEFVGFNAAKHLGENWKEKDEDGVFQTKEFSLRPDPNGDFQTLNIDTRDNSIRLSTGNAEPGPFEGTLDVENMMMTSDGQIIRERFTAI